MDSKKRALAKEIYNDSRNLTTTLQILVSDVQYGEELRLKDESHDQFWRRMILRSVCALGEGILNSLKGMVPKSAEFFDVTLSEFEVEVTTEIKKASNGKTRPFFLPIRDNLKETLKLFTKIHGVQFNIQFDQGYESFCKTFDIRNRLMHPRKHHDLEIKDADYEACKTGWNWFNSTLNSLLAECKTKLPFNN